MVTHTSSGTVAKGGGGLAQMASDESPTQVFPKIKEGALKKRVTRQGPAFGACLLSATGRLWVLAPHLVTRILTATLVDIFMFQEGD